MRVQTLVTSQIVKEHQQDLNVLPVSDSFVCADISKTGGADRDRTGDPRVANAVLSQLSYSPRWDVLFLDMQVSCVGTLGG